MDETEDFQDFTTATGWEKFIADLQAIFSHWQQQGMLKTCKDGEADFLQTELHHSMSFRLGTYKLSLHRPCQHKTSQGQADGQVSSDASLQNRPAPRQNHAHSNQHDPTLAANLEDESVGLRMEERAKLHDLFGTDGCVVLSPNSYSGRIMNEQEAQTLLSALSVASLGSKLEVPCFVPVHDRMRYTAWGVGLYNCQQTAHYISETLQGNRPSARLFTPQGQLGLFAEQLRARAPCAAAACLASEMCRPAPEPLTGPAVTLHQTFLLPTPTGRTDGGSDKSDDADGPSLWSEVWDQGAAWWPWASQSDPCSHLELDVIWKNLPANAADILPSSSNDLPNTWRIHALAQHRTAWSLPAFFQSNSGTDRPQASRRPLKLELPSEAIKPPASDQGTMQGSFTAMIQALLNAKSTVEEVDTLGHLLGTGFWSKRGDSIPGVPSEPVMKDVLRDLFLAPRLPDAFSQGAPSAGSNIAPELTPSVVGSALMDGLIGTAPAESLTARLSLHVMTFSNPRAVAMLWTRFVRELRFSHWEQGVPLPRMQPSTGSGSAGPKSMPDLKYGLLHQKLQMLDLCIHRRLQAEMHRKDSQAPADSGAWKKVEGCFLVGQPSVQVYAPVTQPPPASTEDMLTEQEVALSALGDSMVDESARGRVRGRMLASDMAAFKAANPEAQLVDFVRWHSPKDWIPANDSASSQISSRIGGMWKELWEGAVPCPSHKQTPLMDPVLEGERVLHWFEVLAAPVQIWQLLTGLAMSTALACLSSSDACTVPLVSKEVSWFHKHAGRVLSADSGEKVRHLLEGFQKLERLIVATQSLLLRIPNQYPLAERVLLDCLASSQGRQGVEVGENEREGVESMLVNGSGREGEGYLSSQNPRPHSQRMWSSEMQREWIIEFEFSPKSKLLPHRMYTSICSEEIRTGIRIIMEP